MSRFTFQRLIDNELRIVIITDTITGKSNDFRQCHYNAQSQWMREQSLATSDMDTQGETGSAEHRVLPNVR